MICLVLVPILACLSLLPGTGATYAVSTYACRLIKAGLGRMNLSRSPITTAGHQESLATGAVAPPSPNYRLGLNLRSCWPVVGLSGGAVHLSAVVVSVPVAM